ncbi:hypothetical protein EYC80_009775 [Monilinia laxa]|uniref:Uncharacterized protein n=1 Tax=Monilinia laxa TaxID=61186 RepID=A0A5N6JQN2_MONLA|nr:hypothetical protein EYC80_009775 [Monilinia laxa]
MVTWEQEPEDYVLSLRVKLAERLDRLYTVLTKLKSESVLFWEDIERFTPGLRSSLHVLWDTNQECLNPAIQIFEAHLRKEAERESQLQPLSCQAVKSKFTFIESIQKRPSSLTHETSTELPVHNIQRIPPAVNSPPDRKTPGPLGLSSTERYEEGERVLDSSSSTSLGLVYAHYAESPLDSAVSDFPAPPDGQTSSAIPHEIQPSLYSIPLWKHTHCQETENERQPSPLRHAFHGVHTRDYTT